MSSKEDVLDLLLFSIEGLAFIFSLSFFVWACRTLGLPIPESIHEFWQDLPTPGNLEARLQGISVAYALVGLGYALTRRFVGVLIERIIFQALVWIRRPWGRKPYYDEIMERIETLPLWHIPPRSLLSWYKEFSYIISGEKSLSRALSLPSLVDFAFAGLLHFAVTSIFLPEILPALFGAGWLGPIIGIVFVYFLIRWMAMFWFYFLLFDTHIPRREKAPPSFTCMFLFFGVLYAVGGTWLL